MPHGRIVPEVICSKGVLKKFIGDSGSRKFVATMARTRKMGGGRDLSKRHGLRSTHTRTNFPSSRGQGESLRYRSREAINSSRSGRGESEQKKIVMDWSFLRDKRRWKKSDQGGLASSARSKIERGGRSGGRSVFEWKGTQ